MVPNSIQDQQSLLFNSFTSDIFVGVSDSFDSDLNFFNSVPKKNKETKNITVGNITVKLNSSEKDIQYSDPSSKGKIFKKNTAKNILIKSKQEITNLNYRQLEFKST